MKGPLSFYSYLDRSRRKDGTQLSLFRFPEDAIAETGRQPYAFVIAKKITMKRDADLNIKA
jgi:hypothetical protein